MEREIEYLVVECLKERGLTVATAESCTGGLIGATLVNVAGASAVFGEGYITYSNHAKEKLLGVDPETLRLHGAVSEETAREMAEGGRRAAAADLCVAVTGIAGPDGGTKEKPVGLVYLAVASAYETKVLRCVFDGTRQQVRSQTVQKALELLYGQVQMIVPGREK